MNKKSILITLIVVLVCLVGLNVSATAQKRKTPARRTTPKATTTSVSGATTTNALEIRDGAQKVSTQLMNVTRFIYLLGGIARNIEDIDKESRSGTSRTGSVKVSQNETNKRKVIASIQNLRAGLAELEIQFRTKPALRNYLVNIQGITDLSTNAEDQAVGGQFTEAGRTLLLVIEKLSNTLAALP